MASGSSIFFGRLPVALGFFAVFLPDRFGMPHDGMTAIDRASGLLLKLRRSRCRVVGVTPPLGCVKRAEGHLKLFNLGKQSKDLLAMTRVPPVAILI